MNERLQKIIARAGIASRRRAEDLIVSGQVVVNGKVVTELGTKADPERDVIRVAGRRLRFPGRQVLLALNKPDACVSALTDPQDRTTLREFLHGVAGRVYPVGGLEYHSTGLVILTSDGAFAERLFRALGRGLPQTYHVKVKNPLTAADMAVITRRVGPIRSSRSGPNPWYEVRLAGDRKALLRKVLLEMGHPVEKLKRIAIGRIELEDLKPGRWRALTATEIRELEKDVERSGRPEPVRPRESGVGRRKPGTGGRKSASGKAPGRRRERAKSFGKKGSKTGKRGGREFGRKRKPA